MPWTPAQMHAIQARAHGWTGKGAFSNVTPQKAREMASEGTKQKALANALRTKR